MRNPRSSRSIGKKWCTCLCLLTALSTLAGCTTSRVPYTPPTLPADLAQACPAVPEFASDSWDALALAYIDLAVEYGKCAARHDETVKAYESR
jgi:hypothetical protein